MADISIIIVSWNTSALLLQCLRSIIDTTRMCSLEIIVVDNASTDGSTEAVQREFPTVKVIRNAVNLGFAKANNIGIAASSGRYLSLINSDVVVNEECLDRLCRYMDEHKSVGVAGPKILNSDLTLQLSCWEFPGLWNSFCRAVALDTAFPNSALFGGSLMRFWAHDETRRVDALSGCFWIVRREIVDEIGALDEEFFMYSEDVDFCKRCWKNGWQVVYSPESNAIHFGGASSLSFPVRFQLEGVKARFRYWRKHHNRWSQAAFVGLSLLHEIRRMAQWTVLYILRGSERERISSELQASIACSRWLIRGDDLPQRQAQTS